MNSTGRYVAEEEQLSLYLRSRLKPDIPQRTGQVWVSEVGDNLVG